MSKLYKDAIKHKKEGKVDLSIENYKKLIENEPNNLKYLEELAVLYKETGMIQNSIEYYKKIVIITPSNMVFLNEIAMSYVLIDDYVKAIEYFKKILTYKNDISDVYKNIGICYIKLQNYKSAKNSLLICLKFNNLSVLKILGDVHFYEKKYDESIEYYTKYLNSVNLSKQDKYNAKYNLSFPYLSKNEFAKGFELYENRLKNNNIHYQTKQKERVEIDFVSYWNGIDECNHLLIIYEQGIGDNIQYYRFII